VEGLVKKAKAEAKENQKQKAGTKERQEAGGIWQEAEESLQSSVPSPHPFSNQCVHFKEIKPPYGRT